MAYNQQINFALLYQLHGLCLPSSTLTADGSQGVEYKDCPGSEILNLFSCSTQLGMKSIMHINVKMSTNVGILTFISMINIISESLKASKVFMFQHFSFCE